DQRGGFAADFREVLSRRQGAESRAWRHRSWAVDRKTHRAIAQRKHRGEKRGRKRRDNSAFAPGCHRIVTLNPLPPPTVFRIVDNVETVAPRMSILAENRAARRRRLTSEAAIKAFFGSNALVAIVVLALITIFLFREG